MPVDSSIEKFKCSKNPYRDFGFRNPERALVKSTMAMHIQDAMDARGLTQRQAAEIMGIDQAKVSAIVNGNLKGFTLERLMRFLNALDIDVEITLKPKPKSQERGRTRVISA